MPDNRGALSAGLTPADHFERANFSPVQPTGDIDANALPLKLAHMTLRQEGFHNWMQAVYAHRLLRIEEEANLRLATE